MSGPQTSTGKLLRSILRREILPTVARSVHLPKLGTVFSHAATIAFRRRFAREPDLRVVTRYVAEALARVEDEPASADRVRRAESVVRAFLGERWIADGLTPDEIGDVALPVLCDLVGSQQLTETGIDELVVQAEKRASRLPEGAGAAGSARPRSARRRRAQTPESRSTPPPDLSYDIDSRPISRIGRWLQLSFLGDKVTRSRLPEEPNEAAGLAVIEAAFTLVTQRRFVPDAPLRDIMAFVQGARQRFPDAAIHYSAAELLVREQLGERVPVEGIDPQVAVQIRMCLVLAAFDELGLYDHEVDELLVEAENMAVARGFRPTPAPWPGAEPADPDGR